VATHGLLQFFPPRGAPADVHVLLPFVKFLLHVREGLSHVCYMFVTCMVTCVITCLLHVSLGLRHMWRGLRAPDYVRTCSCMMFHSNLPSVRGTHSRSVVTTDVTAAVCCVLEPSLCLSSAIWELHGFVIHTYILHGLPYISKPASCWQHLPRPGEACC
jgi:hypothetical protein